MPVQRELLTEEDLQNATIATVEKLHRLYSGEGIPGRSSSHEILGILEDALAKYRNTVMMNMSDTDKTEKLKTVALEAIFGMASIDTRSVDR